MSGRGTVILGIETSCDETAAALVTQDGAIEANVVASQADLHARYGGVVPEVASRRHLELVSPVIREALAQAATTLDDGGPVAGPRRRSHRLRLPGRSRAGARLLLLGPQDRAALRHEEALAGGARAASR